MASRSWLLVLLIGFVCARVETVKDSTEQDQSNAAAAAMAGLANSDTPLSAEQIHPFRVLKHNSDKTVADREEQGEKDGGAGGGAAVVAGASSESFSLKQAKKPELIKYFDRVNAQAKNPARRQQEQKMATTAQKRLARQAAAADSAAVAQPADAVAIETKEQAQAQVVLAPAGAAAPAAAPAAVGVPPQTHPHMLAVFQEQQLALDDLDAPLSLLQTTFAPSSSPPSSSLPSSPLSPPPIQSELLDLKQVSSTGAAAPAAPAAAATAAATAPASAATAPPAAAATSTAGAPTATGTSTDTAGAPSTGVIEPASTAPAAPDLPVENSVVPLSHLQQLQQELSDVEAEHAKRQAELNAELKAQQAQTRDLLEKEKEGTVGLSVTPILINPQKHIPIDPSNADLYNNAPTDPTMNIKPSVLQNAGNLVAAADAQHLEFAHNMPLECASPTCAVSQ